MLSGKCALLGVTGGIAAYKAAEVASWLVRLGARVRVAMTEHATRFVAPLTFEAITRERVAVSLFDYEFEIGHISLAKDADLALVAPCTANVMGKLAAGIADDVLTTALMATESPILLAPAMNGRMWRSPAVRANREALAARGVQFVGPEEGRLACGDEGVGRMSEPEAIVAEAVRLLSPRRDFAGLKVLVTAGPTREPLDPVRYLTNRSSGKMGYRLAEAALARGAEVTLVSGPVAIPAPSGAKLVRIETSADLLEAMLRLAPEHDVAIQAAAPSDFKPEAYSPEKLKRGAGGLALRLQPNPDVARAIGEGKRADQIFAAFAAETEDLIERAREKLINKNADLVVANLVGREGTGFDADRNEIALVTADGAERLPILLKSEAADRILDAIAAMLTGRR